MKKMMIAFFVCMLFVSCDEINKAINPSDEHLIDKSIQPNTEEQKLNSGNDIEIKFPANSLKGNLELKINKESSVPEFKIDNYKIGSNNFKIKFKGSIDFNSAIEIKINYNPSLIKSGQSAFQSVKPFYYQNGSWKIMTNFTIDEINQKIVIKFYTLQNPKVNKLNEKLQEGEGEIIIGDGYTTTDEGQNDLTEVKIGTQIWSARNLDVTKYQNGDVIPNVTNIDEWTKLTTGAWCYLNNDPILGSKFGKIYNWYAVNDPRGLAPKGWRIPTVNDWNILIEYLGGTTVAGGKMKEAGTANWSYPNTGATNESGFNALPSGFRNKYGVFSNSNTDAFWWTNQKDDSRKDAAFDFSTQFNHSELRKFSDGFVAGNTVRCIKN